MAIVERFGEGSRILITGGAGFVPSHVVEVMLARGATVVDWELRGGGAVNARIAHRFPQARFEALLAAALAGN